MARHSLLPEAASGVPELVDLVLEFWFAAGSGNSMVAHISAWTTTRLSTMQRCQLDAVASEYAHLSTCCFSLDVISLKTL
jgi:hypothetical protein